MWTLLYINSVGSKYIANYLGVLLFFLTLITFGTSELSNHERIRITDEMVFGTDNINNKFNVMSREKRISKKVEQSDMAEFESLLLEYMDDVLNRKQFEIIPGVLIKKDNETYETSVLDKSISRSFDENVLTSFKRFAATHTFDVDLPRLDEQTGRLFFFKGMFFIYVLLHVTLVH